MVSAIIAFGGNLSQDGVPIRERLKRALQILPTKGLEIVRVSHWYQTPAYPAGSGGDFLNGAVLIETKLDPDKILTALAQVEAELGRVRNLRWGPRLVDLDLISADQIVRPDADEQTRWRHLLPQDQVRLTPGDLILPHPRLQDRNFVLYPMRDIVPDWRHPVTGESLSSLIAALSPESHAQISRADAP